MLILDNVLFRLSSASINLEFMSSEIEENIELLFSEKSLRVSLLPFIPGAMPFPNKVQPCT